MTNGFALNHDKSLQIYFFCVQRQAKNDFPKDVERTVGTVCMLSQRRLKLLIVLFTSFAKQRLYHVAVKAVSHHKAVQVCYLHIPCDILSLHIKIYSRTSIRESWEMRLKEM